MIDNIVSVRKGVEITHLPGSAVYKFIIKKIMNDAFCCINIKVFWKAMFYLLMIY